MIMELHEDHVNGATIRLPVYEFDYDRLLAEHPEAFVDPTTPSSVLTNGVITVGDGDNAVRYHKFEVVNETLGDYLPDDIPIQLDQYGIPDTVGGAICPININMRDSNTSPYLSGLTYFEEITTEPTDLDTNPHYVHGATSDQYGTYSASMRPIYSYAIRDSWTAAAGGIKNYIDKKHITLKVLYTGVGSCHFSVFKQSVAYKGYQDYVPQFAGIGTPPTFTQDWTQIPSYHKTYYGICNKHNICLKDLGLDAAKCCHYRYGSATSANDWRNQNFWQFLIHYKINGEDMYGIVHCIYSRRWGTDVHPYDMYVLALGEDFWGEALRPDSGSWGDKTEPGGADGVWTFPSVSRGDGSGAVGTAIADEARQAMDAFFTGANGFKLHQLLPADIPDIYGTLYSTSFIQRYQNVMYSPLSAVLSVHMIPHKLLDLDHATTPSDLTLSGYNISTQVTQKQYPQIPTAYSYHVGKITLDATDTFLDYAPYTNAYLHLPYIGVLTLDINAIAAGELAIDYITDAITGNCTALVWCSDRDGHAQPKYVAQGNCSYSMPMFSAQQDGSALGRIASSALGITMSVATGNLAGAAAGIGSVAAGMFDAATAKQNTQVTGSFGGNAGMISDTMVWLEIVRPQWCNPKHYQMIQGIPSQLSGTISSYSSFNTPYIGYLQIVDIDTDGITATDQEIKQIEQLLRAGVFVNPDVPDT